MPLPPPLSPVAAQPLSVVLLAHNAAAHLEPVVAGWVEHLDGLGRDYELLVVDDGSSDGTGERADLLPGRYPRLKVLRHPSSRGQGAALRTALTEARNPLLFYTLCEPAYRPADLTRLLEQRLPEPPAEPVIDHVHLLSGYRAGRRVPPALRVLGWLWRLFCRVVFSYGPAPLPGWLGWRRHLAQLPARLAFGLRHHDIACPFRLCRREIFARIPIQSDGPFAHIEVLAKANFLGHVLGEEMPIDVIPPPYRGDASSIWKEARRVFNHPDFGPAVVPETTAPPVPAG
jgi:glycosyltransferase involved in cell wall biosynthesis